MALMRFRSKPRPSTIFAGIGSDDRQPEHLGDAPPQPPEPATAGWTLASYPYPAPTTDDDAPSPEEN